MQSIVHMPMNWEHGLPVTVIRSFMGEAGPGSWESWPMELWSTADDELQHEGLTQLIVTNDMASRKEKMMELGDVFLAFPGGIGTLEEISEVMSQIKLGLLQGRFAFLDFNGYYQPMKSLIRHMAEEGFVDNHWAGQVAFLSSFEQLEAFLAG